MNGTNIDLSFRHQYEVEELQELPSGPSTVKHLHFPGELNGGRDGLMIKVTPRIGEAWLGTFALGSFSNAVTGVYACPDDKSVCIVSSGEGYIVRTDDPNIWEEIRTCPIIKICTIPEKELLVFADFTRISALGRHGHAWSTVDLSWDGIEILDVTSQEIKGLAWDSPQQRQVEFIVNVDTGKHVGGSSPPQVQIQRTGDR